VSNVAIVLLDWVGQILACEQLILGNNPVETVPMIGHEYPAFDPDFFEELSTCCIITPTQNPGKSSLLDKAICVTGANSRTRATPG
jgi:hypothetical protein